MKKILAVCASIVLLAAFIGLINDALTGFEFLKNASGIQRGLAGVFLLGLLYLLGDFAFGWLDSKYKISDVIINGIIIAVIICFLAMIVLCILMAVVYF